MMTIPFNKPFVDSRVLDYIRPVIESGRLSGDGPVCKEVEAAIRRLFSVRHAMLTTSGTHALEMAMMLLDLKLGDEVIMPSFTFVSTANAVLRCGGKPIFCEINDRTLTLDVQDLVRKISNKTRAVAPVHYAGVAAEMEEILEIAHARNIRVIEDAAQGVNAKYKGKYLGTIGDIGAYSFHDTKNYVCGEGGALVTNDEVIARRTEIVREKGTNRATFLRGEVDKYTWVEHGSSFVLSDILAAVLKFQLEDLNSIQQKRKRIHEQYVAGLRELEEQERLRLPIIPEYCESNFHIFYVLLRNEAERNATIRKLKDCGIGSTFHYVPLHSSPYARRVLGTEDIRMPVTDRVSETILRLPIYPQLTEDEVDYVVNSLRAIPR